MRMTSAVICNCERSAAVKGICNCESLPAKKSETGREVAISAWEIIISFSGIAAQTSAST